MKKSKPTPNLERLPFESIASVDTAGQTPNAWIWGVDEAENMWHLASHIFDSRHVFIDRTPKGPKAYFDNATELKNTADVIRIRIFQAKLATVRLDQEYESYHNRHLL